jgi:hypothetical protein
VLSVCTARRAFERPTAIFPAFTNAGYMTRLAQDNPSYTVHLIAASLLMKMVASKGN